jgi:hypothetical protein
MLLKCFKFFYIKDNSVGNSVDFNKKKMDSPYCSDGFNVPRELTAKLYIVERIMGSIGKCCSYE